MSSLPDRVLRRERVIAVIVAVLVLAAVGVVVAFAGSRGAPESGPVAAASSSPQASPMLVPQASPAGLSAASVTPTPAPTKAESAAKKTGGATPAAASRATSGTRSSSATPSAAATSTSTKPASRHSATPKPKPKPTKTASSGPPSAPYFTVNGKVGKKTYFTVASLKKIGTVSASYFSRGKDPKEATNAFVGVRLSDILDVAGLSRDAKRVKISASDSYSASFTLRQVRADYIDETRPGVVLPMIIAYSEDGAAYTGGNPFRLVMGQSVEGDYNRQYWVAMVVTVHVE